MTYIPRREITAMIPNKFEAIRVLALECRRLNDEIRAHEEAEVEGKLTTLAVQQMLEGKVTYYDAKERREQERSEAMLSAAEGLLDIAEPMMETDYEIELQESGDMPATDGDMPATDGDTPATDGDTPATDGDEVAATATVTEETGEEQAEVELPQVEAEETGLPAEQVPDEEEPEKAEVPEAPESTDQVETPVEDAAEEEDKTGA